MNNNLVGALYWYGREKYAAAVVRGYLESLAEEAQLDLHRFRLTLEPSAWVDSEDEVDNPRVFLHTVRHSPSVSVQMEPENATPEELQRLVPYAQSFPAHWERDVLMEAGFHEPTTARDVALPYEADDTPIVLFVDSFLVGRLPFDLTFEEAVDQANERHARALGGVL